MQYLWAALGALCVAGAVCFARKTFLSLPLAGGPFLLELAGAAAAGALLGWLGGIRVGGSVPGMARMLIAAAALAGAGRCDVRDSRIPNLFPALLAGGFVLCTALDAVLQPQVLLPNLVGGLIGGGVVFLLLWLCGRLSHGGVGGGDVKLMAALTCLLGLYGGFNVLLFAQFSALAVVAVLLVLRRSTLKGSIPFAPFFYLGLVITVWLGNF